MPERYFTTGVVARICQVSPVTIAKWIDDGALPGHTTPGGHRRVAFSDLVAFLEDRGMRVPPELGRPGRVRILIAHRDPAYLNELAGALRGGPVPCDCRVTTSGVDALVTAGEWRPDVILLDLHIADLDGHRACRRLTAIGGDSMGRNHSPCLAVFIPAGAETLPRLARETGARLCVPEALPASRVLDILKLEELVPGASQL